MVMPSILVLSAAHLLVGANFSALATLFSALGFLLATFTLLTVRRNNWQFVSSRFLIVLLLFTITMLVLSLQLTPYFPGGGHPLWDWTSTPPIITLDRDATVRELIKLAALGAFFLVGLCLASDDKRATLLFDLIILAGLLFAVWSFVIYIGRITEAPNGYIRSYLRLEANFGSANSAATIFGMLCILSLASILRISKQMARKSLTGFLFAEHLIKHSPIAIIAMLFTLTALFFTGSRSGISSGLIALLIFAAWELLDLTAEKSGGKKITGVFFLLFLLVILVSINSGDMVFDRLEATKLTSGVRWQTMSAHWQAISSAPWSGYGLGSFYLVNDMIMNTQNYAAISTIGALHNVYLQWLEEAGVIGTMLMFSAIADIHWNIVRGLTRRRRMRTWIRAVLCISFFLAVHGMFDYGLQVPSIAITWAFLLGAGFGLGAARPV